MPKSFITVSSNLKDLEKAFKNLGGTKEEQDSIVEAAAYEALSEAVVNAPIDEGFLRRSISVEKNPRLGDAVYSLLASADYAPYVEFGTGERVDVPKGLESFAIQFKGKLKIKGQDAQPYLYPAALSGLQNIKDTFVKFINYQIDN